MMGDLIFELSRKEARVAELAAEVRELTGLLKQAGAECQEWKDETVTLGDSLFTARDEIADWKRRYEEAQEQVSVREVTLERLEGEIDLLRAVIGRLEGEYQDQKAETARLRVALERIVEVGGRYEAQIAEAALLAIEPTTLDAT